MRRFFSVLLFLIGGLTLQGAILNLVDNRAENWYLMMLLWLGIAAISIFFGIWIWRNETKRKKTIAMQKQAMAKQVGESYVVDSLRLKYKEQPETTSWRDAVFKKLLALLNSGDNEGACREAEKLVKDYGHFGILYSWWGNALSQMGKHFEARQLMVNSLEKANEKYPIYSTLAEIAWASHDLRDMVYWLAQAIHVQETLKDKNFGGLHDTYLNLSCIAREFTMNDCADALLERVDAINYGVRLTPQATEDLSMIARIHSDIYIYKVIAELVKKYIKN